MAARDDTGSALRVLSRHEVIGVFGLSTTTLYRMMAQGRFPRPIRLGSKKVGWREGDLQAWLESRPTADPMDLVFPAKGNR